MKKTRFEKQCKECGNIFLVTPCNSDSQFCSVSCYRIAQRKGLYKRGSSKVFVCSYCGNKVTGKSKKLRRNGTISDNIFCNRDCYDAFRRLNTDRVCKYCGKHFVAINEKKNAQFCDDICRRKYFTQKTLTYCVICGQGFYPFEIDRRSGFVVCDKSIVTCSKQCYDKWIEKQEMLRREKISISFTGSKHPNWQGGHNRYRGENWTHQKYLAKRRDEYTCQICGIKQKDAKRKYGSGLEVHHKIPYRYFNNDYLSANKLSNLISLCKACHMKAEWEYRREHSENQVH